MLSSGPLGIKRFDANVRIYALDGKRKVPFEILIYPTQLLLGERKPLTLAPPPVRAAKAQIVDLGCSHDRASGFVHALGDLFSFKRVNLLNPTGALA